MKDRIRQIMESKHMTQQDFAAYLGMSAAALSSIYNERTRPTLNIVEAIKRKMPEVNINWLILGEGDMYETKQDADPQSGDLFDTPDSVTAQPRQLKGQPGVGVVVGFKPSSRIDVVPADQFANRPFSPAPLTAPERAPRKITEIRVFYDDLTYESFVPRKEK